MVDSSAIDPFLDDQNLGLGNYRNREMWQQVESFKNGLYAGAAFKRLIEERSKRETQRQLAIDGWSYQIPNTNKVKDISGWKTLSPEERRDIWNKKLAEQDGERFDRRRWVRRRGKQVFEQLQEAQEPEAGRYPHFEAMTELSGYDRGWEPPHNRMIMARHETSRSRGAQLIDNVFGRVKEQVVDGNDGGLRK